jgi:sulfide:quinone oxidoreductase
MDLRKITDNISVSPQIEPDDIPAIVKAGFRSIMCNRPDGEEPGQCCYDDVAKAALAAGLKVHWLPIVTSAITADNIAAFRTALDEMQKPMLAYCRTGTRCTMMWTIAQFDEMQPQEILDLTSKAGYDMSGLLQQLAQR